MDVNKVIEENMKLIYKLANRYSRTDKDFNDELIQAGALRVFEGLTKRYDPTKSALSTFITREAWGGMQQYMKDQSSRVYVPDHIKILKTKLHKYEEDKSLLTAKYVSEKYGVGYDVAFAALKAIQSPVFVDKVISDDKGSLTNMGDLIPCNSYNQFIDPIVKDKLNDLNEREKIILSMLVEEKKQREIAVKLGVSKARAGVLVNDLRKKLEWMKGGVYACL